MCGISGIIWGNKKIVSREIILKNFISSLEHRGPDQAGLFFDDFIGLAHNRLSIIDLKHGRQPFCDTKSKAILVFNGEIFNYRVLRKELIDDGYRIQSNSDTEVLYYMLEKYGKKCLNKLNGQFSFAYYKPEQKKVLIARDPLGEKPLYYYHKGDKFIFASEIKAISTAIDNNLVLNNESIINNNFFWTNIPSDSSFKDINSLPPGHMIEIKNESVVESNYIKLKFLDSNFDMSENEIEKSIEEAVKRREISDVPLAVYLSGGIDSAIIAYEFSKDKDKPIDTFSLSFESKEFDESEYQKCISSYLGTNHNLVKISNRDIIDNFENALTAAESPVVRTGFVGMYILNKVLSNNGMRVALSGEGADEIFLGYDIFRENLIKSMIREKCNKNDILPIIKSLNSFIPNSKEGDRFIGLKYSNYRKLSSNNSSFSSHSERINLGNLVKNLISVDDLTIKKQQNKLEQYLNNKYDNFSQFDEIQRCQIIEIETLLSGHLLSIQGDRVSMAHSVELRSPFLDIDLFTKLISLDKSKLIKKKNLNEKEILKKIYRNKFPAAIIERQKFPFRAPDSIAFFSEYGKNYTLDTLNSSKIKNDFINIKKFTGFIENLFKLKKFSPRENHAFVVLFSSLIIDKIFSNGKNFLNSKFNYHNEKIEINDFGTLKRFQGRI